MKCGRTRN